MFQLSGKGLGQEEKGVAEDELDMSLSKVWEIVKDREAWGATVHGGHKESDTT